MLRRATSPPLGSSSLITSAPRKPKICAQAGPAWLCVMSMMRMFDNAFSIWSGLRSKPRETATLGELDTPWNLQIGYLRSLSSGRKLVLVNDLYRRSYRYAGTFRHPRYRSRQG